MVDRADDPSADLPYGAQRRLEAPLRGLVEGGRLSKQAHPVLSAIEHGTAVVDAAPKEHTKVGLSTAVVRLGGLFG